MEKIESEKLEVLEIEKNVHLETPKDNSNDSKELTYAKSTESDCLFGRNTFDDSNTEFTFVSIASTKAFSETATNNSVFISFY